MDYTTAAYVNSVQGKDGYLNADRVAHLKNAIGVIRSSGYPNANGMANDLSSMLERAQIYVDPDLDASTHGLTPMVPWYTAKYNVSVNLNPSLFKDDYLSKRQNHSPKTNWENDAELSITLVHEYQHAFKQGDWWGLIHKNEKEDRAYAAAQHYINTLRQRDPMHVGQPFFNEMLDQYVVPSNEPR